MAMSSPISSYSHPSQSIFKTSTAGELGASTFALASSELNVSEGNTILSKGLNAFFTFKLAASLKAASASAASCRMRLRPPCADISTPPMAHNRLLISLATSHVRLRHLRGTVSLLFSGAPPGSTPHFKRYFAFLRPASPLRMPGDITATQPSILSLHGSALDLEPVAAKLRAHSMRTSVLPDLHAGRAKPSRLSRREVTQAGDRQGRSLPSACPTDTLSL
ncbi:hypothetical protein AB1Y20_013797 [Prymnesium parvum]|uniref:Uncharacterized protein n=1 Tax=Prymnesium parvum TaxID=97485 RepID=A0AB34IGG2_PRYPA